MILILPRRYGITLYIAKLASHASLRVKSLGLRYATIREGANREFRNSERVNTVGVLFLRVENAFRATCEPHSMHRVRAAVFLGQEISETVIDNCKIFAMCTHP